MKMEDDQNNTTGETSSGLLPNNTTARSVERTTTQKLSTPILEKNDHTSTIKMTREMDLSKITNSKEVLLIYRDQLEKQIKNVFICAIGQSALTNDEDGER